MERYLLNEHENQNDLISRGSGQLLLRIDMHHVSAISAH